MDIYLFPGIITRMSLEKKRFGNICMLESNWEHIIGKNSKPKTYYHKDDIYVLPIIIYK
jgi:hypothetical protein